MKWRVFDQTLAESRTNFADLAPDDIAVLIDEAVAATQNLPGRKTG